MIRVLYTKQTRKGMDILTGVKEPNIADLTEDYVVMFQGSLGESPMHPDDVLCIFNGANSEMPNPLESYIGQWIVKMCNTHTSMSVGDIVEIDDIVYICQSSGWKKIEWKGV